MPLLILIVLFLTSFIGCQTAHPAKTGETTREEEANQALRKVAAAMRGKPLSDAEVKNLSQQLKTDPEARKAVQSITGSMAGKQNSVKYCPIDGKRYSASLFECPEHHVPLKELDE